MVAEKEFLSSEGINTLGKLSSLSKLSPKLVTRLRREIGEDATKEVKKKTPIDSASMVSTVRNEVNKLTGVVTIIIGGIMAKFTRKGRGRKFVDYSIFVEEGTIKQPGQHMLVRGVDASLRKKDSIAAKTFKNWINQVNR